MKACCTYWSLVILGPVNHKKFAAVALRSSSVQVHCWICAWKVCLTCCGNNGEDEIYCSWYFWGFFLQDVVHGFFFLQTVYFFVVASVKSCVHRKTLKHRNWCSFSLCVSVGTCWFGWNRLFAFTGKTRGAKRKVPKEDQAWLPGGSKQKRGLVFVLACHLFDSSNPNVI